VHATLQLHRGDDDIDALALQQAHLEALPEAAPTVAALARSALRAPVVRAALAAPRSWRELYVAAPVGDHAVEGYVDLLYDSPDGLVLVDYKTDAVAAPGATDAKVARYGVQTAAYALAVEASTGLEVVAAHLVFCTTGEPVVRVVPDLAGVKASVLATLTARPTGSSSKRPSGLESP
jgi:ATP-dependent helicase/nuclease subunit A